MVNIRYVVYIYICYNSNHSNYTNNSFVLCHIESIFGKEVLWDDRHQPDTSLL